MNTRPVLMAVLLTVFVSAGIFAAPPAGEIVYLEGRVDILRDGRKIDAYQVDIGFLIEEFDMVETGSDGFVEFALTSSYGGGATVTVQPGTSFYFEGVESDDRKETQFAAMAGSMGYRVKKLSGNEAFRVRTESAVMGVRGTEFDVTISPEGSVLVACGEGLVEVADEKEGGSYVSQPGQVVEQLTEQGLQPRRVSPSELEAFRTEWVSLREEVFKRGAPTFIKSYAQRYLSYLPKFEEAYAELESNRDALKRFEGGGSGGSLGSVFQAKRKVSPAVVKMRSILPMFEHVFFRLQTLERYHAQGVGRGMINSRTSSERFFTSYSREAQQIKRRISETYFLLRLYQNLHEESGGGPSLMDDPFGDGEGFGGGSMPKSLFD
jgi:hypothetical protein